VDFSERLIDRLTRVFDKVPRQFQRPRVALTRGAWGSKFSDRSPYTGTAWPRMTEFRMVTPVGEAYF